MANLTSAIRQVPRTRQRLDAPSTDDFDRYEPEYEAIRSAVAALAGDPTFDELERWTIETTRDRNRLQTPDAVRTRAREIRVDADVTVPRRSTLRG